MATILFFPFRARLRVLVLGVLALAALSATRANAATAFGLSVTNQIITFDTSSPGVATSAVAVTGMLPGEVPLAIDVRPATGQLYALGSQSRLYVVNPVTGVATVVGSGFTPALSGATFGFDFNPTVDRIRVVSNTGQNFRINPDTGALAATDVALNPGAPNVVGSAYTNNFAGATVTTLYAIDATTDQLFVQNQSQRRHAGAGRRARCRTPLTSSASTSRPTTTSPMPASRRVSAATSIGSI